MATINVYEQYFEADCVYNDVERHAVNVMLIAHSQAGMIRYEIALSFFPHRTADDFAISYDAYFCKTVYEAKGRRSKLRESGIMAVLRGEADDMATQYGAVIYWEKPLIDARMG